MKVFIDVQIHLLLSSTPSLQGHLEDFPYSEVLDDFTYKFCPAHRVVAQKRTIIDVIRSYVEGPMLVEMLGLKSPQSKLTCLVSTGVKTAPKLSDS